MKTKCSKRPSEVQSTFIIKPNGNFLIDIIHKADADGKKDLWQELEEERQAGNLNSDVDPVLEFQNPPEDHKHNTQTHHHDWQAHEIAEQVPLPRRIERLQSTGDRTPNDTTLEKENNQEIKEITVK